MKKCKWFEKFFSDYIEGQLDSKTLLELEQHLQECPHCLEAIQRMKKISTRLQALDPLKTSTDFETVLRTRIRVEMGLRRNFILPGFDSFSIKTPAIIVSAAFIAMTFYFIWQSNPAPDPATPNSPLSILKNDSKLSNSKVVDQVRYELPEYHIYRHEYAASDSNLLETKIEVDAKNPDSLRHGNEKPLSPKNHFPNQIQQAAYTF